MLRVALTGGIGSGKSTVAKLFAKLGITIIDADKIAHQLTTPDAAISTQIIQHFGDAIVNQQGELDRTELRQIIFKNPDEKRWLEALLHPEIRKIMQQQIDAATSSYCLLVIPLLAEAKTPFEFIDRICVVDSPQELQIKRACQRDNISESQVASILKQQSTRQQRLEIANDVISNDGSLEQLQRQVNQLNIKYQQLTQEFT